MGAIIRDLPKGEGRGMSAPLGLEESYKAIFCLVLLMFHLDDIQQSFHFLSLYHTTAGDGIQKSAMWLGVVERIVSPCELYVQVKKLLPRLRCQGMYISVGLCCHLSILTCHSPPI